jgi:hypothetical protein
LTKEKRKGTPEKIKGRTREKETEPLGFEKGKKRGVL